MLKETKHLFKKGNYPYQWWRVKISSWHHKETGWDIFEVNRISCKEFIIALLYWLKLLICCLLGKVKYHLPTYICSQIEYVRYDCQQLPIYDQQGLVDFYWQWKSLCICTGWKNWYAVISEEAEP